MGGVGFSQAKAIIEQLILSKHSKTIHLYWGLQNRSFLYLENYLHVWKQQFPRFDYTFVFFESEKSYPTDCAFKAYTNLKDYRILASGPQELTLSAKKLFKRGLKEEHLYSDWFNLL